MEATLPSLFRLLRSKIGDFPYPHQIAGLLDSPLRRSLEKPAASIDAIGLGGGENVVEIGPGPGFFSVEIARRLTTGRLVLFDVQPEMLDKARRKLAAAGHHDVDFHAGSADAEMPFADEQFDAAFLAEVIGEVPDKDACLRSLARILKPGGVLVFHEAFPDPDRLSPAELRALAEPHGFELVGVRGSRWKHIVVFRKPVGA
jgi:ubiquinone/menaquinone biosynthesis C-methylase UbiE